MVKKSSCIFLQSSFLQVRYVFHRLLKEYVTKKSIREFQESFDKEWLVNFTKDHPTVFKDFKRDTIKKIKIVNNNELDCDVLLSEIIKHLISKLKSIKPGNDDASIYHRTVMGILELIFFPYLSSPQIEQEIHEGRKRIDIVFDNSAEKGFFYRLSNNYNIPSPFIFVECKNYDQDVKNPELDQLSGRLSPNRGKFGLLLCRHIEDMNLFLKRCSDTYNDDRGLIIPLVDDDLLNILRNIEENGPEVWGKLLTNRFRDIALR